MLIRVLNALRFLHFSFSRYESESFHIVVNGRHIVSLGGIDGSRPDKQSNEVTYICQIMLSKYMNHCQSKKLSSYTLWFYNHVATLCISMTSSARNYRIVVISYELAILYSANCFFTRKYKCYSDLIQ